MNNDELNLKSSADHALAQAKSMVVTSQVDYEMAGNVRKDIKAMVKSIQSYWSPKKKQADQLHKSLVQAEKDMVTPLESADKLIDTAMTAYRKEIERQRYEAERERQRIEAEARKAAEEAAKLAVEASGKEELDDEDCEILMMAQTQAENLALLADSVNEAPQAAQMQGISVRRAWKARITNPALVPVSIAGIVIRPIDESALNKLAVTSKGTFWCPGVEFYQEESTMVRL